MMGGERNDKKKKQINFSRRGLIIGQKINVFRFPKNWLLHTSVLKRFSIPFRIVIQR